MCRQENALVSVVVPVYNAEKYIARCIDSILSQTYANLQLILIDDGSPDQSGSICDDYANKDGRILVIHQKNAGVSTARNVGIDHAKGEYLFFVDSDDWVEPTHIACLLPEADEDLVYGGRKFFVNGSYTETRAMTEQVVCREAWITDYTGFSGKGLSLFFVSGCYDMQIIRQHGLRFDTALQISEDGLFNLEYMKYCQKIRYSGSCTYCYEDGDDTSNSLSHRFQPLRTFADKQKCKKIEALTGKQEYMTRWKHWQGVLRHYRKWLRFQNGARHKEASNCLQECYRDPYFRECIPHVQANGTLDERLETYFMRRGLHRLFDPICRVIAFLSRVKQLFLQ